MVNDADQLDIVRRIERGHGSAYSVNGREIRARDVQTLFADAATGSRSTALVSQGRIGALINAKPADRRTIIDEAAGITGLYARRHEAELRLRAAEQNLARVQDVLVALEEQHKGLKRQARQASRYRNLSDHIRRAEAAVLALKLAKAESELAEAGERLKEAEAQVADLTRLVGLATTAQAEAATALPPLRNDEAAAAAALQRLRVAHDALTAEAERVAAGAARGRAPGCAQTETDLGASAAARATPRPPSPSSTASARGSSRSASARMSARPPPPRRATPPRPTTLAAEAEHDRLTRQIADDEALRESMSREVAELQERLRRLAARREEVAAQQRQIEAELVGPAGTAEVEAALEARRAKLEEARRQGQEAIEPAREAERYEFDAARAAVAKAEAERLDMERARAAERQAAEASHAAANEALQKINARLTKLRAEESGVAAALKSAADSLWPPLLDALTVDPGFEKALGAAFGEELEASSDRGAPIHWLPLGPLADAPALPEGATPLGAHVKAPAELARRLAFIGIVADDATGADLQAGLRPGQQLVTARRRGMALGRLHHARRRAVDGGGAAQPAQPAGRDPPADRRRRCRAGRDAAGVDAERAGSPRRATPRRPASSRRARTSASRRGGAAQDRGCGRGHACRRARRAGDHRRRRAGRDRGARPSCRDRRAAPTSCARGSRHRAGGGRDPGDVADGEMRRTFRQARLSSISDTQADRVAAGALRGRIAELRAALVEAEGNCDRLAREAAMRRRAAGPDRPGPCRLEQAPGRRRRPDRRARRAARADRAAIEELAAKPAEIEAKRMALGEEIAKAEHKRQGRPTGWPPARRGLARPTRR